jgi:hypothetical protein
LKGFWAKVPFRNLQIQLLSWIPTLFLEQYIRTADLAGQKVFNIDKLYDDLKEKKRVSFAQSWVTT